MGNNKYGRRWTQEELGAALNPPVNRAAVNKWETGLVEGIKKTYIEQLAAIFGVTPTDMMCFSSKVDESVLSEEVQVIESVQKVFGKHAVQLLQFFTELNDLGQQKVLNDIGDMVELQKYKK